VTTIRNARREDLAAVVGVMNAVDIATLGEPDTTEDDIASGWDESGFDVESDAFVAEDAGAVVGYAELYDRGEGGVFDTDVYALPDGPADVAEALLQAVLDRAGVVAPSGSRLSTWVPADDPRGAVFEAAGFKPARRFVRMRYESDTPPDADAPDGVTLRPFRRETDAAEVHLVMVDAFARHIRPMSASFERFSEQHLDHPDFDESVWTVAEADDEIVGAISAFDHGDIGFIRHVGVRGQWRRRGVGSALVRRSLQALHERGQHRVDLGVDINDDAGADRVYERIGFRVLQRLELVEKTL